MKEISTTLQSNKYQNVEIESSDEWIQILLLMLTGLSAKLRWEAIIVLPAN